MVFDYGITDTELIVEGEPPSQSVLLEATFEVSNVQVGEDVVTTFYSAQAGAPPTQGDIPITDPSQQLKFATATAPRPNTPSPIVVGEMPPPPLPTQELTT